MKRSLFLGIVLLISYSCRNTPTTLNGDGDEYEPCSPLAFPDENFYYTFGGKKIPLTVSSEKISMKFVGSVTLGQIQVLFSSEPVLGDTTPLPTAAAQGFYVVDLKMVTDVEELVQRLKSRPEVAIVNPVYLIDDSIEIILYDRFIVRFKMQVTQGEIDSLNQLHNVEIVRVSEGVPNQYTFRITPESDLSVLKMSNLYYECLPSEWSLPDFFSKVELHSTPNDPYFQYQ